MIIILLIVIPVILYSLYVLISIYKNRSINKNGAKYIYGHGFGSLRFSVFIPVLIAVVSIIFVLDYLNIKDKAYEPENP